jgi:RecA-family ATPase
VNAPLPKLEVITAASFAGVEPAARPWLVEHLIPRRAVTLISGDGGVGKSLLMLQGCVSVASGRDWVGLLPEEGAAVYVSAEDDIDEIHRRLHSIATAHNINIAELGNLHFVPLAGRDAILAAPDRHGVLKPTDLWRSVADLARLKPALLVIDNLADAFAGNENSRPEARQFVGLLRGFAIENDCAVVLIAHPSLTGMSSGSGISGSTAWNNSVRSRLYLDRPKTEDGEDLDPDARVLSTKKANYGPISAGIRLRWENGVFRLESGASSLDRLAADAKADRAFLDILAQFQREGRDVSPNPGPTYAPVMFAAHPSSGGIRKRDLKAAMDRLLAAKKIIVDKFGPPSKSRSRLVEA